MRWLRFAPLALLLLIPALAQAATTEVGAGSSADGNVFVPVNITITAGDSVHWTHTAGTAHNVHIVGETDPVTPLRTSGDLGTRTFSTPGTVTYYCDMHGTPTGGMRGVITVNAAPTPTPTSTTTPAPGVTPTATPPAGGSATPTPTAGVTTAKLGTVKRRVKAGKVRGSATVAPAGQAYAITVKVNGKRAGRVTRSGTAGPQAFAVKLSKAARHKLATAGKLKVVVIVQAGAQSAKRTVTLR
ncbi:MAG: Copper binding protein plastocyanin/azurin family [Solirubrobacteraceae bacterium]|nr:Copper binding protein plastocyanin/azurin family [Solirubrobacteraceae bacterium]